MKILVVINNLAVGGAEKLLLDFIPEFNSKGFQVDLLLLNGSSHQFLKELKIQKCCDIHFLTKGSVYNPLHIFNIIPFLKKYDIVHVHLFPALYWVALAKALSFSKTKLVFTEHSTSNRRRNSFFFRQIDRWIYRRYARVVVISTEVKLLLKRHLRLRNSRFRKIPNGVDFQKLNTAKTARKAEFAETNEKIIIQVARFSKQKDQETLLRAIPFISHPVQLLLVGDGPEILKIKELARTLEISKQVHFLGIRSDVPQLLKMADIAVMSSHHEGLSLSGIEAMASGTPLVASKVFGLSTLVHGAGILFAHADPVDLASKIERLLNNPEQYNKIALLCEQRAKMYSLDKMIRSHIQLYSSLCQNQN
jgi:glycosyltransferase involved in cell wall biosynthesis